MSTLRSVSPPQAESGAHRRWAGRPWAWAVAIALGVAAAAVVPPWFHAYFPPWRLQRIALAWLGVARVAYPAFALAVPSALAASAALVLRARRRGRPSPRAARVLALAMALTIGIGLVEAGAAAWLRATRVAIPRLPTGFPDPPGGRDIDLLVVGESSARGVPYGDWLSVGDIVAWRLREALPARRVHVDNQASPGFTLGHMQDRLLMTTRRPDLAIVYAGHNEFQSIYDWSRGPFYYADETPPSRTTFAGLAQGVSPLCRMIEQTRLALRISVPPPRTVSRQLVDVPVATADEARERLHQFRTRLEATVSYLEGLGAVVVLIIPPGNEAGFEPNRSVLPPGTAKAEREAFARAFRAAREAEAADPARAVSAYRALIDRQPGFAESHFRLARLLEREGRSREADRHYARARDLDGFPMRCPSDFQDAYRAVAARHPEALLVDGPAVLRARSPRGVLDDWAFADGLHPSLNGYAALAEAVLEGLHARRAFGWPGEAPPPHASPAECAAHFGMDAGRWDVVCRYSAWFYGRTAFIRHDPSERLAKAERYRDAARRIVAGEPPAALGLPGVGTGEAAR